MVLYPLHILREFGQQTVPTSPVYPAEPVQNRYQQCWLYLLNHENQTTLRHHCTYLVSAFALAAFQLQQATASSLQYAPYTTCTSYGIGNKAFPGRGRPIEDNGNCVVTVPKDPNSPKPAAISTVPVKDKSLLSNCSTSPVQPVFKKAGTRVMSENRPPIGTNPDAYVEKQQATSTSPTSTLSSAQ
ncbi:hypothetical protein ON010_g3394 [Phytophthora cinnamomi]|nr:hypothetical protein ON010_g3394 [Phytophthora cinnamomi]